MRSGTVPFQSLIFKDTSPIWMPLQACRTQHFSMAGLNRSCGGEMFRVEQFGV